MVVHSGIFLEPIVVHDLAVGCDYGHAEVGHIVLGDVCVEPRFVHGAVLAEAFLKVGVVVLEFHVERVNLVLLLACLLEDDECHGKQQEYGEHTEVELVAHAHS